MQVWADFFAELGHYEFTESKAVPEEERLYGAPPAPVRADQVPSRAASATKHGDNVAANHGEPATTNSRPQSTTFSTRGTGMAV